MSEVTEARDALAVALASVTYEADPMPSDFTLARDILAARVDQYDRDRLRLADLLADEGRKNKHLMDAYNAACEAQVAAERERSDLAARVEALEGALTMVLWLGHIQDDGLSICPCKVHRTARALLSEPEAPR